MARYWVLVGRSQILKVRSVACADMDWQRDLAGFVFRKKGNNIVQFLLRSRAGHGIAANLNVNHIFFWLSVAELLGNVSLRSLRTDLY